MKNRIAWAVPLVLSVCVGLTGCGDKGAGGADKATDGKSAGAKPANPPVNVSLVTAEQKPFDVVLQATGTLVPAAVVDIRAQMSGVIRQVHVKEGQLVQKGQLLYTLDAQADEANLARMKAQLLKDEALLADAQRQLERSQDLLRRNFVAQGAVDTSQATRDSLKATVAADRAAIDAARISVGYSQVRAAGSGRLGALPVVVGSTVKVNDTSLGTIVQTDPMDVQFALPQDRLPALLQRMKSDPPEVLVELPGVKRMATGKVSFIDNAVDAATGTVKVKARLENSEGLLWAGLIVQARLRVQRLNDAVVVPAQAILQSPRGTAVFAVREGKAEIQPVKVLAYQDDMAALSGLQPGEKVVVDGRQNVRPGAEVTEVVPASPAKGEGASPEGKSQGKGGKEGKEGKENKGSTS